MRRHSIPCAALLAWLAVGGVAAAQQANAGRAVVPPDPYTAGDAVLRKRLGYTSVGGPFPFGTGQDTAAISELLADEPLLWIETEHFRLGCSLSELRLRGDFGNEWLEQVRGELKQLANRLPQLKADTRVLDPWLRAHLIAMRLEALYDEVAANLRESERDPGATGLAGGDGNGPFLGMNQKFTVLLVKKCSSLARYTRAHQGGESEDPMRRHDVMFDCTFWGAAEETSDRLFANDFALHAHLVFNVAHNLYSSYRGHGHDLPPWVPVGLGHWHARHVTPRFPAYDRKSDRDRVLSTTFWQWDKRVDDMLRNGTFRPLPEFCLLGDSAEFGVEQHVQSWALVDWLMQTRKDQFMRFIRLYKEPFRGRKRAVNVDERRDRQNEAMQKSLRLDPAGLEQAWREFVRKRPR